MGKILVAMTENGRHVYKAMSLKKYKRWEWEHGRTTYKCEKCGHKWKDKEKGVINCQIKCPIPGCGWSYDASSDVLDSVCGIYMVDGERRRMVPTERKINTPFLPCPERSPDTSSDCPPTSQE